jgi:protein-S-isoprenylcysteine O-methyltransferase Ste14
VNVAIAADHRVVEAGPYRLLRHPSYTGALLAFLGLGICLDNWASLALLTLPTSVVFLWRMRIEEDALLETFGERYRDYMRRTRRLIPFIY